jgi:hypothetical protein
MEEDILVLSGRACWDVICLDDCLAEGLDARTLSCLDACVLACSLKTEGENNRRRGKW